MLDAEGLGDGRRVEVEGWASFCVRVGVRVRDGATVAVSVVVLDGVRVGLRRVRVGVAGTSVRVEVGRGVFLLQAVMMTARRAKTMLNQ